jgi:hypothetical protein
MEDDSPVLFYKASVLAPTWLGYKQSLSQGIKLLKEIPEGTPVLIPPTPIDEATFTDIFSLSVISPDHIEWWKGFRNLQFPANYGSTPAGMLLDFWLSSPPCDDSSMSSQEDVEQHPPRYIVSGIQEEGINFEDFEEGEMIIARPDPNYVTPDGEDEERFWVARIIRKKPSSNLKVEFFRYHCDTEKYERNENWTSTIPAASVLFSGFTLTKNQKIRSADLRKILAKLD